MTEIRVLIVDDHGVMRAGLRSLIDAQTDMVVIGEAKDGVEAVQKALENFPDVVVLDLELPGMSGIQVAEKIIEGCVKTRVLALTMHDDRSFVRQAVAAGATGFVAKEALGDELMSAIRTVHQGRTYINVALSQGEAEGILDDPTTEKGTKPATKVEKLSEREQQVLELLAQGFTNQQIGERLHLSPKTIGTYRYRISEKLGLETRADIVHFALKTGILGPRQ